MERKEIIGLSECSENMLNWTPGSGCANQIFYDRETGEIWCRTVIGDSRFKYHDPAIILVATVTKHATETELIDWVSSAVEQAEIIENYT